MTTPLAFGITQFTDQNGSPYAGGSLSFYQSNTLNPKTPFQDTAGQTPTTNPLILDGSGRATIYGQGSYRVILKDASGNKIWDKLALATVPIDDNGNLLIPNTITSNNVITKGITTTGNINLTGTLLTAQLLTTSTSTDVASTIRFENTASNGINLKLLGNGTTTPAKYIRVYNGNFDVVNSDYSDVIFSVSDDGKAYCKLGISVKNQVAGSTSDLSRHIDLYSGTYGASITAARLNLVAPNNSQVMTVIGGTDRLAVHNTGASVTGVLFVSSTVSAANVTVTGSLISHTDVVVDNNVFCKNLYLANNNESYYLSANAGTHYLNYWPNWYWGFDTSNGNHWWNNGAKVAAGLDSRQLVLEAAGNVSCWTGTFYGLTSFGLLSDEQTKTNITNSTYGLKEILQLSPKKYNKVINSNKEEIGFIAQDVQKVIPHAVSESSYKLDDGTNALALHMDPIVAALVKATKELHGQIKELKKQVADLVASGNSVK